MLQMTKGIFDNDINQRTGWLELSIAATNGCRIL